MSKSPQEIYEAAVAAAKDAVAKYIAKHGDERDGKYGTCGFAWVVVRPARGPFVKWCKANDKGRKHWAGGWEFWNPADYPGQNVNEKEEGARAFAEVLKQNGLEAYSSSRLD